MIKLEHVNLFEIYKTGLFELNNSSYIEFESSIEQFAKSNNSGMTSNEFKGMAFEIFNEYYLKKHGESKHGIIFKNTTSTDKFAIGIDSEGLSIYGDNVLIQSKYRNNHTEQFKCKDLATFINSIAELKNELQSFDVKGVLITNVNHSQIISCASKKSALHNSFKTTSINKIIGREDLIAGTNYQKFWLDFYESIKSSLPVIEQRIKLNLNKFQKEALNEIVKNQYDRGQILMPTGTGKTLVETLLADYYIKNHNAKIILVIAPRIALTAQLLNSFRADSEEEWNSILINSGEDIPQKCYHKSDLNIAKATTNAKSILNEIENSFNENKPIILFSTNHSANTISLILKELDLTIDLAIGDEAHNFTNEEFGAVLKKLYNNKNIKMDNVSFVTIHEINEKFAKSLINNVYKYQEYNEFIEDNDLPKFDVIIGNPPYKKSLHLKFLEKAYDISKKYVFLIHPETWLSVQKPGKNLNDFIKIKNKIGAAFDSFYIFNGNFEFGINMFGPCIITKIDKCKMDNKVTVYNMKNNTIIYDSVFNINPLYAD